MLVTITAKLVVFLEFRMLNRAAVAINLAVRTASSSRLKLRHAIPVKPFEVSFIHQVRWCHHNSIRRHYVTDDAMGITNSGRVKG